MDALSIVIAGTDDVDELAHLRAQWTGQGDSPEFTDRFRQWWNDEADHRTFWLARRGADAIAMVNLVAADRMPSPLRHDHGAWAYLGNMFVEESERGRGVGRQLLAAVLDHADASGVVRIMLNPTERSRPFYARAGFVPAADGLLLRPHPDS